MGEGVLVLMWRGGGFKKNVGWGAPPAPAHVLLPPPPLLGTLVIRLGVYYWERKTISVKLTDGSKIRVKKSLLLSSLFEIYVHFKEENPNVFVGFSTFATL